MPTHHHEGHAGGYGRQADPKVALHADPAGASGHGPSGFALGKGRSGRGFQVMDGRTIAGLNKVASRHVAEGKPPAQAIRLAADQLNANRTREVAGGMHAFMAKEQKKTRKRVLAGEFRGKPTLTGQGRTVRNAIHAKSALDLFAAAGMKKKGGRR